jgi:phosphohistidine swiveling domain-containing protein
MRWKKILAREYGVQYTELSLRSLSPECGFIVPAPFYEQVYIPEDVNEACYVDEEKWLAFVSSLQEKYLDNPDNCEEFERLFMETGNEYMNTAKRMANENLKEKSDVELKDMYLEYQKTSLRYAPFIWIQFLINNFFAERAKEIIASKVSGNEKRLNELYAVALKPQKKAASVRLHEIGSNWENMSRAERNRLYEEFKWLPCLDIHNKPWTKKEFSSHLSEFEKPGKAPSTSYGSVIEKIKPSVKEKQLLDIARRLAYLKDLKDDFRRQGVFHGRSLFEEIAKRTDVELEDISYLQESEIVDFLANGNKVPEDVVKNRKNMGFVIYFTPEHEVICKTGEGIEPALEERGFAFAEESVSEEIRGTPASPGKVSGRVTIVKGVSDLDKVKKGDILVAVTTHPDYVPAMRRAAAIVTDEGGLTSHAAIVSREFGLPCVVGTRRVTKLLKDGDTVEVDADSGSVVKEKPATAR